MSYTVTLTPSGHSFLANPDQSILQAALDAGLTLPYGCRNGACGSCKSRLVSGLVEQGEHQQSALGISERHAGYALLCCASARSDLVIESREVGAAHDIPVRRLPCRVEKMERPAPDVMILGLKVPANERLQFLAGQYIEFVLKDGRRRAFSLANAPHDDALLQLHVRRVPGGRFTEHVFDVMKERDILRIEGPFGDFYLREASRKPILLLAGGTGFAPIKSLIEHAVHSRLDRPMTLYWGARTRRDLYLNHLPECWQREHTAFRYVPVLSESPPEEHWEGRRGLVHRALLEDFPDLSGYQVYACGAPAMIDAARRDLVKECGLPADEFFADAFSYAADSQ
jgi:CDP-4-dehydro-6-deoxyglucose reductase